MRPHCISRSVHALRSFFVSLTGASIAAMFANGLARLAVYIPPFHFCIRCHGEVIDAGNKLAVRKFARTANREKE